MRVTRQYLRKGEGCAICVQRKGPICTLDHEAFGSKSLIRLAWVERM